ncbi:BQ2448_1740 [Microbotryum intermedium]|uniref:BQ2448_1740 protein n=1 Tax=Microbotryum intermedium TaxID=269621 RepID=A0A238FH22_9BASI|nr:BQ2448_1740 [Microbotryum intermedium]
MGMPTVTSTTGGAPRHLPATEQPAIYEPPLDSTNAVDGGDHEDDDDTDWEAREEDRAVEENVTVTPALIRFGFDTGVVSGALLVLGTSLGGVALTTFQQEWLVSSALLGALVGSIAAGQAVDRFGRKPLLVFSSILFILGAFEQAAAQVYKEVILGRIIVGVAVGISSAILPIYLSECSPAKFRGRIVASLVVLITAGQVLAYFVDAIFFRVEKGWRFMFGLGSVPAIVQLLLSFNLVESPNHLISKGRIPKARKTLKSIYPRSGEASIQRRIERIEREVTNPNSRTDDEVTASLGFIKKWNQKRLIESKNEFVELIWRDRANRKALILAIGLQAIQQATGFNCLMYYSGKILQAAHFSNPASFAMIVAITNFLCTIIALRLIDRLGRRPLLLRTLLGMSVGMLVLGISFFFIPKGRSTATGVIIGERPGAAAWFALVGMAIFTSNYALGVGNVAWVIQSEVFSHELRGIGTSLATVQECNTGWTVNLIVASTYLHLAQVITPGGAFLFFAVISLAGFLFAFRLLPETKGLGLHEIKALFEDSHGRGGTVAHDGEQSARGQPRYERVETSGEEV